MAGPRTFTFLGTGTSVGVPMLGCDCAVCRSTNPKNHRTRTSALVATPQGNILIDTGPELRLQLLRERVKLVHAVLYTHYHADHLYGLDDLRLFPRHLGHALPVYCNAEVEDVIRKVFGYAFGPGVEHLPPGAIPKLALRRITTAPFEVLGQRATPVPLEHGRFRVFGFRFDDVAYCTDVSAIPDESWPLLEGLKVLILDALRHRPHPAHFNLDQALDVIDRVRPEKTYLTHIAHEIDHESVSRTLPRGVELAYDGLKFEF
jgi:phosphoribosyl 1,2-cyclic phosphate phosphodiesterase